MIKRYDKFIESRKHRVLSEGVYTEKHHILPRCLGGNNDSDNLIDLTAKKHRLAHIMLARETKNPKLCSAVYFMTRTLDGRLIPSSTLTLIRKHTNTYEGKTREELDEIKQKRLSTMAAKTQEELDDIKKRQVYNWKITMSKKSEEEKNLSRQKAINTLNSHSQEWLNDYHSRISNSHYWESLSDEELADINRKRNETRASWSEEFKIDLHNRQSSSMKGNQNGIVKRPMYIKNLLSGDYVCVDYYKDAYKFLSIYKDEKSMRASIQRAIKNDGYLVRGYGKNSYNAFYIEYL